jgi:hypothetical protein
VICTRNVVFNTERFYKGPKGYVSKAIIHKVVKVLAILELIVEDDIAINELLIRR